MFVMGCG